MEKENTLLILWIIFGFVYITGIDSILYFIIYIIYFSKISLGLPLEIMKFSMPIITLVLYSLTTYLIIRKLKINSISEGLYITKFPKKAFITFAVISLILNPITNKLSGLFAEYSTSMKNVDFSNILSVYGWMTSGIYISRWLILIF